MGALFHAHRRPPAPSFRFCRLRESRVCRLTPQRRIRTCFASDSGVMPSSPPWARVLLDFPRCRVVMGWRICLARPAREAPGTTTSVMRLLQPIMSSAPCAQAGVAHPHALGVERRKVTTVGKRGSSAAARSTRRRTLASPLVSRLAALIGFVLAAIFASAALGATAPAGPTHAAYAQALEIEAYLQDSPSARKKSFPPFWLAATRHPPAAGAATSTRCTVRRPLPPARTAKPFRSPTASSAKRAHRWKTRCLPPPSSFGRRRNGWPATPPRRTPTPKRPGAC